jgi:hypothetical protein
MEEVRNLILFPETTFEGIERPFDHSTGFRYTEN